jgi:hypothetical protein
MVRVANLQGEAQEFNDLNSRRIEFSRNRSCSLTVLLVTLDCSLTFALRSVRETVLMNWKRLCRQGLFRSPLLEQRVLNKLCVTPTPKSTQITQGYTFVIQSAGIT